MSYTGWVKTGHPTLLCTCALDMEFIDKILHSNKIQAFSCPLIPFCIIKQND